MAALPVSAAKMAAFPVSAAKMAALSVNAAKMAALHTVAAFQAAGYWDVREIANAILRTNSSALFGILRPTYSKAKDIKR